LMAINVRAVIFMTAEGAATHSTRGTDREPLFDIRARGLLHANSLCGIQSRRGGLDTSLGNGAGSGIRRYCQCSEIGELRTSYYLLFRGMLFQEDAETKIR
jgi:hypothetical protein